MMALKAKKMLKFALIAILVLFVCGLVFVFFGLNIAIKKSVESSAPTILKVPVSIEKVQVSPFSGSGKIRGLVIGNPEGFKTDSSFKLGLIELDVSLGSLITDTVVINRIVVHQPQITYERGLKTSNIHQLLENISGSEKEDSETPGEEPDGTEGDKSGKKVVIKTFDITDGAARVSVTAMMGKSLTIPIPDIHLQDIGKEKEAVSRAEAWTRVLQAVLKEVVAAAGKTEELKGLAEDALGKGGEALKQSGEALKDTGKALGDKAGEVAGGLKGLLKRDKD